MDEKAEEYASEGRVTFAWWNTSLAPSAKSRSTNEDRLIACAVIMFLINDKKADFVALGEMSKADFDFISEKLRVTGYVFVLETTKVGRSSFDVCYAYNSIKLLPLGVKDIVSKKGGATLKIAKRIDLFAAGSQSLLYVFISHWPSRLWCVQNHADRHYLGVRLRDSINDVIELSEKPPFIILLGDYNDEPFNDSLSEHVMATRDMDLVIRRAHLFYNPFWRYLGKVNLGDNMCGSYYYKSGAMTRWHTFDQIIFSHAFLKSDEWELVSMKNHIVDVPEYTQMVKASASKFDHLPVYGAIEKVNHNG